MASFTTRVELHDASFQDYQILHSAMEAEGFTRTISSSNVKYKLPTAEYNRIASVTQQQVLDSAKRAANETGRKYAVLVTESVGRTSFGLEKVK